MFSHSVIGSLAASALLVLTTPGAAAFDQVPQYAQYKEKAHKADARNAGFGYALPALKNIVKLEDSLQWRGRDVVAPPVSLFVTDLLPGNC